MAQGAAMRLWIILLCLSCAALKPAPAPRPAPPSPRVQAPPPEDPAARRERFLLTPPLKDFDTPAAQAEGKVRDSLKGYTRDGAPLAARLEAFGGLDLPLEAERCYRLVVRLGKGAAFSEVARRGLQSSFQPLEAAASAPTRKAGKGGLQLLGTVALSPSLCVEEGGPARFTLGTRLPSAEHELGQGPVTVEVWKQPNGPYAESAAARDQAIARETRGYALARSQALRLESFKALDLPVRRGTCYAVALKFGKGAAFTPEVRRSRAVSFMLDTEGQSLNAGPGVVGPGGVAQLGCPQRSEKGKFKLAYHDQIVGSGPVTLQVFTRAASEAQLRREPAEDRAERAASNRNLARMKSETCQACVEQKISCHRRGSSTCYEEFLGCVRSKGYRESECGG